MSEETKFVVLEYVEGVDDPSYIGVRFWTTQTEGTLNWPNTKIVRQDITDSEECVRMMREPAAEAATIACYTKQMVRTLGNAIDTLGDACEELYGERPDDPVQFLEEKREAELYGED